MLFALTLIAGWIAGPAGWAGAIEKIRVHADRVDVTLNDTASEAAQWLLPAASSAPAAGATLTLDLMQPAILAGGGIDTGNRRLSIALRPIDMGAVEQARPNDRIRLLPPFRYVLAPPSRGYSVAMAIPSAPVETGAAAAAPLPPVEGADTSLPLVVLDPGHGGRDPGATGADGLREKDLTLATARAIRDALIASGRVRVALTRDDDRFIALEQRYRVARRLGAALFVSIHCDSAGSPDASGATIYTLSEVASDKEAARLAARENMSAATEAMDADRPAADIASILLDLTQRQTMTVSAQFAQLLGREARARMPVRSDAHRMASLMVLKAPDMPSVLFETGYLSNPRDARFIASPEGRTKIAESVRRAVEIHFATRTAAR
ncbi:N-acetylmuramoyl-L-alanine amidase family protein [Sphingomonas sp. RS6]